jgi:hypothetical protein
VTGNPVARTATVPTRPGPGDLASRADATVDFLQAEELASVLQRHSVPQEMILLYRIGHTFAFQTWGKKRLPRDLRPTVVAFLAKHMPAMPSPRSSYVRWFS